MLFFLRREGRDNVLLPREAVGLGLVDACGRFGLLLRELLEVLLGFLLGKGLSFCRFLGIAFRLRLGFFPLFLGLLFLLAELLLEELVLALAHGGVSGIIYCGFLVVEAVELARLGPFGLLGLLGGPPGHGLVQMQRWRQAAAKCSDARRRRAYVQFSCVERRAVVESAVLANYQLAMANIARR